MKALLLAATLAALTPCTFAQSVRWTKSHSDIVEQTTIALTPKLREQTVLIGRLGVPETRIGTIINKEGDIIAPLIPSIDGEDAPYLLYRPDGSRTELATIAEKPKRFLSLLKLEGGFPNAAPLQIAEQIQDTVVVPTCAPIASLGEPISLLVDHLQFKPGENASIFRLEYVLHYPGTAVFDISGNLIGFTLTFKDSGTDTLTIKKALTEFPELANLLPDLITPEQPALPSAPELTREEIKELNIGEILEVRLASAIRFLPSPLPCVLVFNEGAPLTNSAVGTIIRSDGLILSKASELGPSLSVRYAGKNYPGLLLATDEETDLALISIDATNMPVVSWHEGSPIPGQTMISPVLLKENTEEMVAEEMAYPGTMSHLLKSNTPTLQASSQVTSLGLYTEQIDGSVVVAALAKDSPAYASGLAPGDLILSIEGTTIANRTALTTFLDSRRVGDTVTVTIERSGEQQEFPVQLIAPNLIPPATGISMRTGLAMIPSVRRAPFSDVLVHTTPLNAWDCGSPLFNRERQAVALNIAAFSQGRSLALLPKDIKAAIIRMLSNSRPF
ncbi:PDZ domain-containing protein [Verrucomicrobiaceae bacterium 227]